MLPCLTAAPGVNGGRSGSFELVDPHASEILISPISVAA